MSTPFFALPADVPFDARRALDTARDAVQLLARWVQRGWLREVDAAFAQFLAREAADASGLLILAAAFASHQLGRGHACLDLSATLSDPAFALSLPPDGASARREPGAEDDDDTPLLPSSVLKGVTLARWKAALAHSALLSEGEGDTPLVLSDERLYLRRYWRYEQDVCRAIGERIAGEDASPHAFDMAALRHALDALFPANKRAPDDEADWQKLACALAAKSAFAIVTGGPGTGKTTTVVKLLALLQAQALASPVDSRALRIRLAAPTGKAAARLNESIAGAVAKLPLDAFGNGEAIRAAIPVDVTTLHRLLGTVPNSRRFRHHAGRPLSLDVLVIDEASMVDLEMMNAVLAALPRGARIVLLGDKDQLASVEAGAVLGELCSRAARAHYTPATQAWLEAASGEHVAAQYADAAGGALDQCVAMLRKSHRFSSTSGIGKLAFAVNEGKRGDIAKILARGYEDIAYVDCPERGDAVLKALAVEGAVAAAGVTGDLFAEADAPVRHGYRHYLKTMRDRKPAPDAADETFDAWAHAVLSAHGEFQLLSALRRGPWGVEGLNRRIARLLQEENLIHAGAEWYAGRPVLVTQNDYELGLMNGDIGITLARPGSDGKPVLRVAFAAGDGSARIRWVLPSRLQAVETVFALTVHKSQGSEFTHAALVLPERISPVLTRELVYTGITRARKFLTIASAGGMTLVEQAVQASVQRASGLSAAFDAR
ncbi:DNA helicase/exodeoxyribonuclease V, alpha subunit [Caballeronia hypogeia]|uniref:RecBCD enzyme subunit RecD n=1 Tax=Caballeronia hypogeia TaxID=1777140 RepID=A0A158CXK0_9BURK|nr:exodeoxyribonuclease V subunit alpha [Caballeronia hypogeia]SAK87092.1 DNA helicase/exodeoxyribonuclease V, alpha subunit [Caballeronia hypogeia]